MLRSYTAVRYIVPYSCDCRSIKTQTNKTGSTWTRSRIELRNCSWLCRCWSTIRRHVKSSKSPSDRSGGHSSLVHLGCNTPGMLHVPSVFSRFPFPVFPFELELKKTYWADFFGHWHRLIWCRTNLCVTPLLQPEQSRHYSLCQVFQTQNEGHECRFPGTNRWVLWFTVHVLSLTALAIDTPMVWIWPFSLSSSSIRARSSAIVFSSRPQSPGIGFGPSRVPSRSSSSAQCHNSLRSGGGAPSSNACRPEILSGQSAPGWWITLLSKYIFCSSSTLITNLVGIMQWGQQEN